LAGMWKEFDVVRWYVIHIYLLSPVGCLCYYFIIRCCYNLY